MPIIEEAPSRNNTVYVITPWKQTSDLLAVKRNLFRLDAEADRRQDGVDMVAAWTMRGNVPHAIQSTAQLISAQLHHESEDSTSFSAQSTYTTAFCRSARFITGYCDIATKGVMGRSMHAVAEDLDMPASWIDTRHEATHGRLPSLNRLAATTREALSWLWQHYWSDLEKQEGAEHLRNTQQSLQLPAEIRAILAAFVKKRIEEIKKAHDPTTPGSAAALACIDLIRLCRGDSDKLRNVARLLVEPKMLVPADRRLGQSLEGAFTIWSCLLRALGRHQTQFLPLLLLRMTTILSEPGHLHPPPDAFREAVCEWLVFSLEELPRRSKLPDKADNGDLTSLVLNELSLTPPTLWTEKVAGRVLESSTSEALKMRWLPYFPETVLA